jgi:hypothetical protein
MEGYRVPTLYCHNCLLSALFESAINYYLERIRKLSVG